MSDVRKDRDELRAYQRRNRRERDRERRNWRAYDATEFGQYDEQALAVLIQEGRPPTSFNILKRYIDTITGSILADGYDIHYETELGDENNAAILFNELYMEDRDLGNFLGEFLEMVRAGFIYRGWMEMYIDRSRDPRGRVGLRYLSADRVTPDPDWTTHRVKDNKSIHISNWMAPQQILDRFKKKTPEIQAAIKQYELSRGGDGESRELDKLFDLSPEFFDEQNGLYLVSSKLYLEKEKRDKLFDLQTQQFLPDLPAEDLEEFKFAAEMSGSKIEVIPSEISVCKVKTFCPALSLDLVLEEGNHGIQTGGYPLFAFSSDCINGRPNTPTDQLYDVQLTINKRESTKTHVFMTTSYNTLLVEEDATSDPEDAKKIATGKGRPGAGYLVTPGTNRESKIRYMEKNQPPAELMSDQQYLVNLADKLTPSVPALQGLGEEGDSGVLFQAKVAQAQIGIQIPSKFLKAFWNEIGDAYFFAAQQTYTYPMVFNSKRLDTRFVLNMEGGIWMEQIPRMRVTVTQSPTSETYRRQLIQQYVALNQYIPGNLTKQALARLVVKSLPNVPDEELDKLAETAKLEEELQKEGTLLQLEGIKMQRQQQMAMAQGGAMGMMPGMPGAVPQAPSPQDMLAKIVGGGGPSPAEPMRTAAA
jgi:hypothetical protein